MADRAAFADFVAARSDRLLRSAYMLTRDWELAEDLMQEAMAKAWFAWRRLGPDPEAYVRKIIFNTYANWWRRRNWRGEVTREELPEPQPASDMMGQSDERDAVLRALGRLAPRQRAVIVLRFYEDLTEAQAAEVLGCSTGTIKSQTARALAKLRVDDSLVPAGADKGKQP